MTDTSLRAVNRGGRTGSPGLVLFLALCLVAAAVSYSLLPQDDAGRLTLALLALLAIVGLMALFFFAVGFLQVSSQAGSNDLTKTVADTSPEGLLISEDGGRILYANESYMAMSGTRDGVGLRGVERLFAGSPDVSEAVYRLAQAARDHKRGTEEMRLSPALVGEAAVGWYRVRVRPIGYQGRDASLWTVADVTRERERHENVFQELRHAIDYLDHAPAGFFSAEPDGRISYMNATLTAWLDYDLAQVGSGGLYVTDLIAADGAAMLTAIAGAPAEVKTEQFDIDLKRRNGQRLPVRILHRVAFSQDGIPGSSRTLVINQAPGETPSEDLRAIEVRFARLFNSTPMAMASVDAAGTVTRSNAAFAKLFGDRLRGGEAGRAIYAGLIDRDRAALQAAVAAAVTGKSDVAPVDASLDGPGNRAARFYVSAEDEREGGRTASIFALDTTEQRTLQESFAQAQKMQAIGQLAGGVAHDFNNVLTAIIGYSDLLLANHRPTDPSFQDIMQIKQNANRAAGLVRQLLAFSRRQTLRPEVIQFGEVLAELQNMMRRLVGEKIDIDVKHGRDLWLVKADVNQLEQVIVNLVVNARDAMLEGGRVTVRTRNVAAAEAAGFITEVASATAVDCVMVEIEDNGQGIPPDVLPKIFEPFFTTKEVGKGTGLGLSTVYGIVKQTGGFIFCDSTVGIGTTFRILLPRFKPADKPAVEEVDPKAVAKPVGADLTGRGTILLVEDEEAVRAFGARALTSRGYTVLEAGSGVEALQVVEDSDTLPDIIVSDVVMPEMDGPTMLGELRKRGIKAKMIFVSGYAEDAFEKNLPEGQEFTFLPKPFSLKQLVETVKEAMEPDPT
ncbi:ATP-binding protein [Lichenihabitans sp. Uapishka_5]|uniref:cell cycle histidine kinase CckA n=1 Tax=Lichenihabitans sp. Uapishka_5 TaxID=3037302 RepID=UPI0029E81C2C|nr:ATP-binding protein [Lichenihabitans sp. Uapishka_5]MDX7949681.1 ATP-binding protein [Lichenihabitans sp. Uapishka_5]